MEVARIGGIQIHFPYSALKVFSSWSTVKSNNTLIREGNSLHRREFVVEEFLQHLFNHSSSVKVMFASFCLIECSINEHVIDTFSLRISLL